MATMGGRDESTPRPGGSPEDDLLAIVRHRAAGAPTAQSVVADETHSAQPGTAWEGFDR